MFAVLCSLWVLRCKVLLTTSTAKMRRQAPVERRMAKFYCGAFVMYVVKHGATRVVEGPYVVAKVLFGPSGDPRYHLFHPGGLEPKAGPMNVKEVCLTRYQGKHDVGMQDEE